MNEKLLVFIGGFIFAVVTARKVYAPNRDNQLGSTPPPPPQNPLGKLLVDAPTPVTEELKRKCPESVELGCGMPPHKISIMGKTINTCTDEVKRGTPFIQDCISSGLTRRISRPV